MAPLSQVRIRRAPRWSRWGLIAAAVVTAIPAVVVPAAPASAATPVIRTPGFSVGTSTTTDMPTSLTNFVYLPSGRIIAIGKEGHIRQGAFGDSSWATVTVNGGSVLPVNSLQDRGLVGIDLAPDFATSRQLFLLYNYDQTDCAPAEQAGSQNKNNVCGRLSRWTANDANAPTSLGNETVILDGIPAFSAYGVPNDDSHTVGTVVTAPDGTLFVGTGEASSWDQKDPSSHYAQDITSPRGKIFHIDGSGNGLASNPFYNGVPTSWQSRIFAYGLRNPFRFSLKPGTGGGGVAPVLYLGDVGSATYEEIDVAKGGENFGWPCYEGPLSFSNEFAGDPQCANHSGAGITAPLWSYQHGGGVGNAVIGGAFYPGSSYGSLNGAYFFADATYGVMWTLKTDANDAPISLPADRDDWFVGPNNTSVDPPNGGVGIPVAFRVAPNGNIAFADLAASRITELRACTSGCPPAVVASVAPAGGKPNQTTFRFDAAQSYDPDGDPLTFTWDFGDGTPPQSGSAVRNHIYTTAADFTARVTVSDGHTPVTVNVPVTTLHSPPTMTLTPNHPGAYAVGEPATVTALAYDDLGQQLTGTSIRWQLLIHHCPDLCHIHPTTPTPQPAGVSFTTPAPDHGGNFYLEFRATATASYGLSVTKCFNLPIGAASAPPCAADPGLYTPVQPYRLFDTRNPAMSPSGTGAPLSPGETLAVDLSNQPGAPADKTAVLLNVTTDQPQAAGYVKAFPCGAEPYISTVNFDPGQTAANLAMVRLPADGKVCFTSFVPTHVIVDVSGWFAPAASGGVGYTTIPPERVLDTRDSGPLQPMQEFRFSLAGKAGFPSDATAALINLTATNTAGPGYVRVYPCGQELDVSNVNYGPGQNVANLASVKVAAGGDVCFRSWAQADIVVDLAGWYTPEGSSLFVPANPVRVFDTRSTPGFARLAAGQELPVQIAGGGQVPGGATSVALNVTAAAPDAAGYVAVYPCGTSPFVSNVNYRAGQVAAANLAVVKLPGDGRICFKSFAPTDIVVDLAGWYVG